MDKYRSDLDWIADYSMKWWRRKKRKQQVNKTITEIQILRQRVQALAHEANSWRWSVGGAMYAKQGIHFKDQAEVDLRNKVGHGFIPLSDEDFLG